MSPTHILRVRVRANVHVWARQHICMRASGMFDIVKPFDVWFTREDRKRRAVGEVKNNMI